MKEYLSDAMENCEMEMHVLSQQEVFEIVYKEQGKVVEVLEDGCIGLSYGVRSNTFLLQKSEEPLRSE